jgi:hypothetical protein
VGLDTLQYKPFFLLFIYFYLLYLFLKVLSSTVAGRINMGVL